jgi:class 3 adenylate cyclase/tetratricopeptide (TPR) repeat protein
MTCPRCQKENSGDAVFCQECGTRLETACPSCGTANQLGAKFCKKCGQRLSGPQAEPAMPGPRFAPPESYTPKHLAEKILTSKAALEGERKQVTVLFADLKGSMELLADRDPEEARKLLDPVLERMMEAVHRYEGTVNQVMGDGIMALFGAPLAHEDHAVRACYAALNMQAAIRRYAEDVRRSHGVEIQIRVGLNSGEVVVRAIGSDLRMDYSAIGQTTHLAARMEQLAPSGSIRLSANTLRLAEGFITVKSLGPVPIKGLDALIEVYELTGAGPFRSRLGAAAARGLTRFVGRESELDQLRRALGRAAADHGQVVAIVGEAGVGKSRLVWEVTHSHRTHGWLIVQARSVSYGKATPYLPVIDLLRSYFQIEDRDDPRKVREKVTGKLLTLDESLKPTLPAVLNLLDVPPDDPTWQTLDPPQRRLRTLDALNRLLLRESQVQPLLVIFEDLHWIDSETQALLEILVERVPTARLLLLVNYRPEYEHRWATKTYYTQLRLDPLAPENAEELLLALLGGDPSLRFLKRRLIEQTEGNPFFLEESVRTLAETGTLVGERGAYRPSASLDAVAMPATVQAVLAARIDRLPPEEKILLQTASVIGKDVPFDLLQAIADLSEADLRSRLAHLEATEFLYETSLFPRLEYTFKHALTQEVAFGELLQERRRVVHARIVEAVEHLHSDRLAEHVERLAHHAFQGGLWDKAFTYARETGIKAFARSANRKMATAYEQALDALAHLPPSPDRLTESIDLRFELRNALVPLGEIEPVLAHLTEAARLAESLQDKARHARACSFLSNYFWFAGDPSQSVASARRARVAATPGDFAIEVTTKHRLGAAYHALGDYPEAIRVLGLNVEALQRDFSQERFGLAVNVLGISRYHLVLCFCELGEFPPAVAHATEAVRRAERPHERLFAHHALACLHLARGEWRDALDAATSGFALTQDGEFPIYVPYLESALGYAMAWLGGVDAIRHIEQAVEQANRMSYRPDQARRVAWLAEAHYLNDQLDKAAKLGERALVLSRRFKERGNETWALHLLGSLAAGTTPPDVAAAEANYGQALVLAAELGMRPLVAHCHLGLGKLYRRTGDDAKMQEHLTTAKAMYREMGMGFWLEKAEAAWGALR